MSNQDYFDGIELKDSVDMEYYKLKRKTSFLSGMIVGLIGAILIALIYYLMMRPANVLPGGSNNNGSVSYQGEHAVGSTLYQKLQALEHAIDSMYFLEAVTDEELRDGAYRGFMEALGDPYSVYYSVEEMVEMNEHLTAVYYGIGAYVTLDAATSLPMITKPIAGSPAEKAGLCPNDLIYAVEGETCYGLELDDAVAKIKGPEGTTVNITVLRNDKYLDFSLVRAKVNAPTAELTMMEDGIAYIELVQFADGTPAEVAKALADARTAGMKGLIIDLRGNPGGSLNAVVEIARMLLPKGLIVYTEDKSGKREEFTCDGKNQIEVPLVILIDGNSASASEIPAGAVKDYNIGTLVGTTTFGKGLVQQLMPFKDGSALKLTISAYFTPNGTNIHGIGVEPHVECPFDGEAYYGSEDHPDNQLEKAKSVLREQMMK
jgi:carboxyl-terminal processing protease